MSRITYTSGPYEHIVMAHAAVAVAVDDDERVALIAQRLPLHGDALSVPGGMVENGENPVDAARRELAEETGINAGILAPLGSFAVMTRSTQVLHVFEAHDLTPGTPTPTPAEAAQGLRLEWIPLHEALTAVHDGRVILSGSALALLAYATRHPVARPAARDADRAPGQDGDQVGRCA